MSTFLPDHPNARVIRNFYAAFTRRDAAAMAACYAPAVQFSDPVFPDLKGPSAGAMWAMLCGRAGDLKLEVSDIAGNDARARAHWEAWYTFTQTGRKVHNIIEARFEMKDGLIVRHVDEFDFHRWAHQALGLTGLVLGWTGWLQRKVQGQAAASLRSYMQKAGLNSA